MFFSLRITVILIFIPGETVGLYCTVLLLKFYLEFCIPFCLCSLPLCLILILEYITDRLSQHFSFFLQEKKKKKVSQFLNTIFSIIVLAFSSWIFHVFCWNLAIGYKYIFSFSKICILQVSLKLICGCHIG